MRRFASLLLLLLSSAVVEAAVLDVYPDGSGPYPNLMSAAAVAQPGDTIRLADGVFAGPGNRNVILDRRRLTILSRSGDPEACGLDLEADGRGFLIYSGATTAVRIQGIAFHGGDPRLLPEQFLRGYGAGLAAQRLSAGGSIVVERCIFEDATAEAGGGAFLWEAAATFGGCVFRRNVATDGAGVYAGYCTDGNGVQFTGCLFRDNTYPYPSVGGYGGGIYYSHSLGTVELCTLAGNHAWLGAGVLVSTASDVHVEGVLIAFSPEGQGLALNNGQVGIVRCDFYGNAGGDWTGAIAGFLGVDCNMQADPIFCGAAEADYTVRADSPCLAENNGCGPIGAFLQGCLAPGAVDAGSGRAPGALALAAPSPQPCGGAATIAFALPAAGHVRLRLIDLQGRVRATLMDGFATAGVHRFETAEASGFKGRALGPGVYQLRLEFAGQTRCQRLIVLR